MLWLASADSGVAADDSKTTLAVPLPAYRVETDGFAASEADIRAVLDSASRELWRFFPDYKIDPIVVTRGHQGPITLYQRNDRGEIVIRLDTEKTYWSQYAYQFAHEFCHVLCGYREGYQGQRWFEETLCEAASLYVMQSMSRTWKTWRPTTTGETTATPYGTMSTTSFENAIGCTRFTPRGLPEFYRAHQAELEKDSTSGN